MKSCGVSRWISLVISIAVLVLSSCIVVFFWRASGSEKKMISYSQSAVGTVWGSQSLNRRSIAMLPELKLQKWLSPASEQLLESSNYSIQQILPQKALARAIQPHGFLGARWRLRKQLQQWVAGNELRIAVFGNSMTKGVDTDGRPWSVSLQRILSRVAGVLNLSEPSVSNHAWAGTASSSMLSRWDLVQELTSSANIIVVDYALTDITIITSGFTNIFNVDMSMSLVEHLLDLPNAPAVLFLETWSLCLLETGCINNGKSFKSSFLADCALNADVTQYPHWPALFKYGIPVISYSEAVCENKESRAFWVEAKGLRETGNIHASFFTHELISQLIAYAFIDDMKQIGKHTDMQYVSSPIKYVSEMQAKTMGWSDHPSTPANKSRMVCEYHSNTRKRGRCPNLRADQTAYHAEFGRARFPGRVPDGGWHFIADHSTAVDKKMGWVAIEGQGAHDVLFDVVTGRRGVMLMEYLRTYGTLFGNVSCSFDGCISCAQFGLHGGGSDLQASLVASHTITQLPPCARLTLRCKSDGSKFKILGLVAC